MHQPRLLFYPGCLINHVFPNIGLAAYQALFSNSAATSISLMFKSAAGCRRFLPVMQKRPKDLILQNLKVLSHFQFDQLITACPTCAYAIKKIWSLMVGDMDMGTDRNLIIDA